MASKSVANAANSSTPAGICRQLGAGCSHTRGDSIAPHRIARACSGLAASKGVAERRAQGDRQGQVVGARRSSVCVCGEETRR